MNLLVLADTVFNYTPTGADWLRILPELVVLAGALLVLLVDLLLPARGGRGALAIIGMLAVVVGVVVTAAMWTSGDHRAAFDGMVNSDLTALFADLLVLFSAGLGLLYSPGYIERQGVRQQGEYYALLLLAALGMMLMASAGNLMTVFVGLEVLSLSLYILSAYLTTRSRSQEAGMKYFILSSFASAFLLYGMALTYGATGSTGLSAIRTFLGSHPFDAGAGFGPLLLAGIGLMTVGFCFKVSAVPFQAWTPDVYVGAPTSVTAFMSVGTKVAAFVALARVFMVALHAVAVQWTPVLWVVAVLTMVAGNVLAVSQRDVKRMLAYSSVANAGYILVAVVTDTQNSLAALLVYLAAYAAMNLGAFGGVLAVEHNDGLGTSLEDFAGLARRRPGLAATMALFLFALAGIPPTIGFVGKYSVFFAAITGGHLELAIIGVLASVLGVFYYLRVIWAMYFVAPPAALETGTVAAAQPASEPSTAIRGASAVAVAEPLTKVAPARVKVADQQDASRVTAGVGLALAVAAALTLGLGIIPGQLYDLARQAAATLFR